MLKAAIFDIDGTLIDSVDFHAEAWQRAFHHFGYIDIQFDEVRTQIGKGGDQLLPVFLSKEEIERIGKQLEEYRSDLFRREYLHRILPFPKVRELFIRLKNDGYQLALASSSNEQDLEEYKRIANIADLLEAQTSSDNAEKSKPAPDIFEAALQNLGKLKPEEAVVIGDTPYDAQAASKSGIQEIIGVLCGGFAEADLRQGGCREIFRNPADLLEHYERSPFAQTRKAA
jgi:HAD superfamily hydrolase (TIGR01549 family)